MVKYWWNKIHYADNDKIYFGSGDDAALYFDGTYFRIDGNEQEVLFDLDTAGATTIYGGATTGDDLTIYANSVNTYPFILLAGGSGISQRVGPGDQWEFKEGTDQVLVLDYSGSVYKTDTTSGAGFTFDGSSVTTGKGVWVKGTSVTTGSALFIQTDSDTMTTGQALRISGTADAVTNVFTIDALGNMMVYGSLVSMANLASGANQGASGAGAGELWRDTTDNTIKLGV
jgi:hypothetical protein